jgi:hypothetical protein
LPNRKLTAHRIANLLLSVDWRYPALQQALAEGVSGDRRWQAPFLDRIWQGFGGPRRPTRRALARFIHADPGFSAQWKPDGSGPIPAHYPLTPATMEPPLPALANHPVPAIHTPRDLASFLGLSLNELLWFADPGSYLRKVPHGPLQHYHYQWRDKADGSRRLIEIPKSRLKRLQRQLLERILLAVPVHPAAHGFVRGRSCLSAARPHSGQAMLIRLDLEDFFASIGGGRIFALYRTLGYPETVASLLQGLCCNRVPEAILRQRDANGRLLSWPQRNRLAARHLPQGAPSSPTLANLCAWRLDQRLAGLARAMGLHYTRYADDLALSGDHLGPARYQRLQALVGAIALEEGFALNHRKTRRIGQSQRQRLLGLVINQHPNIPRQEFDQLKAILTNCQRHGPASQNRNNHPDFQAHLRGRIARVAALHPGRGEKLMGLLGGIEW